MDIHRTAEDRFDPRAGEPGIADHPFEHGRLRKTAMAKALDLEVIAEGIETETQRQIALDEGCTAYQGFLRARPLTQEDFLKLAS